MMSTIFCDNDGCMFSDGCGFCHCGKLSIVGGVCEGSMHGGRNASDGDIDERLKAENEKLRELLGESLMDYKLYAKKYGLPPYLSDVNEHLDARLRELGIEVPE